MAPLQGLRVVDLSRNVAGPFAAMVLGDLGADVVKVERPPAGDDARRHGPPFVAGESPYFLSLNRNKRSIVLNLKRPAGREVALALVRRADVLVNNFRPGVMRELGLGWETLTAANPRLIACNITGFGKDGPWAGRAAYDHIIQGMSGLMSVTGDEASGPWRTGVSISDLLTGLFAVAGILAALQGRAATGTGEEVNVSLLDASLAALTFQAASCLMTGQSPRRHGNDHPMIAPYGTFRTADGLINVAVGNDGMFRALCGALGLPEVADRPQFADNPSRVENRPLLTEILARRLAERPTADWVETLGEQGVACGPVLGVAESLRHPQAQHEGMVQEIEHPSAGRIRVVGSPIKLAHAAPAPPTAPPRLGEHTLAVLRELGFDEGRIQEFAADGVVAALGPPLGDGGTR